MNELYEFGSFLLDPQQRLLQCNDKPVPLTAKAFELLVALVERHGRLVEKDELLKIVWPNVVVEEGNLAVMVSHLRKALGDDRESHQFIETVPRHGYRFIAPVTRKSQSVVEPPESTPGDDTIQEHTPAGISAMASESKLYWRSGRRYALAVALVCVAFLGWQAVRLRSATVAAGAQSIHSLAVLPFQEIGPADGIDYLGEGTADAVITRLGQFNTIVVRPTTAIERYRNSNLSPLEIGRQQSVDAILEGHIQRQGDRIRLTVQLVRVDNGAALWADSFDEKFTDIFALEDEISAQVAQSLRIHLSAADEKRLARKPTENTAAYEAYLKGRFFWNKRTTGAVQKGLDYFRESIRLDPRFADGYEGIADCYATLGLYGSMPPEQAFPAARQAAMKALDMDNSLADAHATLGLIYFYYDWDGNAAENEFRRALDLNPNYAMAHSWSGETLAAMGNFKAAVEESQRAMEDDPLSLIVSSNAGWTIFLAGQTDSATQILRKAIELDPNFPRAHFRLGMIYEAQGRTREAIDEFNKAVRFSDGNPYYQASLANAYADAGDSQEAKRLLKSLKSRAHTEYVPAFGFALVYAGLHDTKNAIYWLQRASADHSTSMAFAKVDPSLASLRSDSRFAAVAQNLRF